MKKIRNYTLSLIKTFAMAMPVLALALLIGCGGEERKAYCDITVKSEFPEYSVAVMKDVDGRVIASDLKAVDGVINIERNDTSAMPYFAFVLLKNEADSMDYLEIPVAVEAGSPRIIVGERMSIGGTELNDVLDHFLAERSRLGRRFDDVTDGSITVEKLREAYSNFYMSQILENNENIIGRFIYRTYGVHLLPDDRGKVEKVLNGSR